MRSLNTNLSYFNFSEILTFMISLRIYFPFGFLVSLEVSEKKVQNKRQVFGTSTQNTKKSGSTNSCFGRA